MIFLAVPAEEDSGLGTLAAIRRDWTADLIVIPEPTARGGAPEIVVAQAGAMTVLIEVEGRSAHASTRRAGENALEHFLPLFRAIREHEAEANATIVNPAMSDIPLPYPNNVGTIEGGEWASSVMDALTVAVRVAVPVGQTVSESFGRFERAIQQAAHRDPWLREHPPRVTCQAAGFGSSATPEGHPLVQGLVDATEAVAGVKAPVVGAPFGCDMAAWIRHAEAPCVLYGPGDIELAHAVNEWVSLDTTVECAHVLLEAVERLLELDADALRSRNAEVFGSDDEPVESETPDRRAAQ